MSIEYPSHERTDEEFAEAFNNLLFTLHDQVRDPHLVNVHAAAVDAANYLNTHRGDAPSLVGDFVQQLDQRWEYCGQSMELTGTVWVVRTGTSEFMMQAKVVNHQVTSRGFMLAHKGVVDVLDSMADLDFSAGHYVDLSPSEHWPEGAHGVAFIDDIEHLALPYPSQEMRGKDLLYYHPDIIEQIDKIIAYAGRPDQTFKDIGALVFSVDQSNDSEVELMIDIERYLVEHLPIDVYANYRMKLQGEYVKVDDAGSASFIVNQEPAERVALVTGLRLLRRPAEFMANDVAEHDYIPYLALTILEPGADTSDWGAIIPCESIEWIASSRYDQGLGPTYRVNDEDSIS